MRSQIEPRLKESFEVEKHGYYHEALPLLAISRAQVPALLIP